MNAPALGTVFSNREMSLEGLVPGGDSGQAAPGSRFEMAGRVSPELCSFVWRGIVAHGVGEFIQKWKLRFPRRWARVGQDSYFS